jgi:hypothetical protein
LELACACFKQGGYAFPYDPRGFISPKNIGVDPKVVPHARILCPGCSLERGGPTMPAASAHLMITDEALVRLRTDSSIDRALRGTLFTHSHFVRLGCVSPDLAYLDFYQPAQHVWADHMHYDATGDVLKAMATRLLAAKRAGLESPAFAVPLSWTLGYLSHVAGDLVVHPVVRTIVGD